MVAGAVSAMKENANGTATTPTSKAVAARLVAMPLTQLAVSIGRSVASSEAISDSVCRYR